MFPFFSTDILVIGVGDPGNKIDPKVIQYISSKKINIEVLSTEKACATFNFLNSESRCVAGALIPPTNIKFYDEDRFSIPRNGEKTAIDFY